MMPRRAPHQALARHAARQTCGWAPRRRGVTRGVTGKCAAVTRGRSARFQRYRHQETAEPIGGSSRRLLSGGPTVRVRPEAPSYQIREPVRRPPRGDRVGARGPTGGPTGRTGRRGRSRVYRVGSLGQPPWRREARRWGRPRPGRPPPLDGRRRPLGPAAARPETGDLSPSRRAADAAARRGALGRPRPRWATPTSVDTETDLLGGAKQCRVHTGARRALDAPHRRVVRRRPAPPSGLARRAGSGRTGGRARRSG